MSTILRRHPDPISGDYTASHDGRGEDYDENFERLPFRALLWELEQAVLAELVGRTAARSVLDIACGTGRITELLARELPSADVIGVDVADSMLARARDRVPGVTFIRADVRNLHTTVPEGTVDLVTAFRFFPNADAGLRAEATRAVAAAVRPGGFILLNNHRNFWSPSYVARRLRSKAAPGTRNQDLLNPFRALGFRVVARRSLGVVPHTDRRAYLLPQALAERAERAQLRLLSRSHCLGTDTMWLLQRGGLRSSGSDSRGLPRARRSR